ncbi:effector-associated constant component EACC1 [Rhodococcus qingshengii]|jgi:translation elongation factor EF-Tu-like GTPase|nr:hypothetical protein AWH04_04535 [Rhodococcus erythropolis]
MSNQNGPASIQISGNSGDLVQLLDWIRRDEVLRGRVQLQASRPADGQMGGLSDVLMVTLGGGGAVTILAKSLSTWFTTRHSDLTLKVTLPNGTEISVDGKRVKQEETFTGLQTMIDSLDSAE